MTHFCQCDIIGMIILGCATLKSVGAQMVVPFAFVADTSAGDFERKK